MNPLNIARPSKIREFAISKLRKKFVHYAPQLYDATYISDGLITRNNANFLTEGKFAESWASSESVMPNPEQAKQNQWRVYTCCFAAAHARGLTGDFVELGVDFGRTSMAAMQYIDFPSLEPRRFWLVDAWEGVGDAAIDATTGTKVQGEIEHYCSDVESIRQAFSPIPRVEIVKGYLPKALDDLAIEKIAYLHLDLGADDPEIGCFSQLWTRLEPGAVVVSNGYARRGKARRKQLYDAFLADKGLEMLSLPTGQGLFLKPPQSNGRGQQPG